MWGPAIVMVRVVRPSDRLFVCQLHANISEIKRDKRMVARKLCVALCCRRHVSKLEPEVKSRRQRALFRIQFWGHISATDQDIFYQIRRVGSNWDPLIQNLSSDSRSEVWFRQFRCFRWAQLSSRPTTDDTLFELLRVAMRHEKNSLGSYIIQWSINFFKNLFHFCCCFIIIIIYYATGILVK